MRRHIPSPLPALPETLMAKAGYIRHCVEAGRTCYHRQLNDPPFPRFHALVAIRINGMEVDLHFDALDIAHKGNHDQPWAYEGMRVEEEMQRILQVANGEQLLGQINHADSPTSIIKAPPLKKKRSIFELLFRFK